MTEKAETRGRPTSRVMPERIPDTPENILKAVLSSPPRAKGDWDYLKRKEPKK